jgi:anti-sigma factor RsiW
MKTCSDIQRALLLLESGELPEHLVTRTREHLASCSECQSFQAGSQSLLGMTRAALPDEGPAPETLAAIYAYAREATPRPVLIFRRPVMQVAAAAALLLVCLGGWSLWPEPPLSQTGISDIQAVLALVADDDVLGIEADASAEAQVIEHTVEVLLRMQGLSPETLTEEALWEPQATPPQARSTPGLPVTRYG